MFAEFEDDDDYDEVDEDQQEQAPTAPAVPVVASVDPASVMTTNTQQGGTAPVPVGGGMDDDDYDEEDYDDPLGGGGDDKAPTPTVVVPTVAATAAVGLGMAQPAPVVPTVAAASAVPPGVPMVETISALEAAAPPKPALPKRPRTKEERGAILKFTDIALEQSKAQKKQRDDYDKDKDGDNNLVVPIGAEFLAKPRAVPMVQDDPLEEDDEEEDELSDEDEEEEDGEGGTRAPPPRGWDQPGAAMTRTDEFGYHDSSTDEEETRDGDVYDQRKDDAIATRAGDGHFKALQSHTPAEQVEWEEGIHWGDDSDEEEEEDEEEEDEEEEEEDEPAAALEPTALPEVKQEIKAEPMDQSPAKDAAEPAPQQPKKLLFRLGGAKPPAASNPPGETAAGDASGEREGGGDDVQANDVDEGGIRAITTGGGRAGGNEGAGKGSRQREAGAGAPMDDAKGAVPRFTAGTRGWWGEDPDAPLDVKHVPFTRHAQYTRLWHDDEPTLGEESELMARLALEKEKEKEKVPDDDAMDVDGTNDGDDSPDSSADAVTHVGAGVFGPGINSAVEYRASQPGAADEFLARRNQALARGEWLDGVHWTPATLLAARANDGAPRVTINPNDRMMRLRSYFPGGEEEMKNTDWAVTEADIKPGRHLQPVEDVDAQLNIGLDSDDEGAGARNKEFDIKKDKGLVGRPGRLDNIFNAAVVSGSPVFKPHSHIKSWPKPEPLFAPPAFQVKTKAGLALGFKSGADDKFQVLVKSFTTESASVKILVRPSDSVDGLLRKLRKKWPSLKGTINAHFPEGDVGRAYQVACQEAAQKGEPRPKATPLDPASTMEQCGIKRRVPEPLLYVEAPDIHYIDEAKAREEKPPAVAAALAALARAMGEETEADAAYNAKHQTAEEVAAAAAAIAAGDPAEAVAMAMSKPSDLTATNGKLMLVQYAEDSPPLIAKPGMGAKRVTYYRRRTQGDTAGRSLTQGGQRHVIDLRPEAASPFISDLPPGQPQESLETTMYRAPMFRRVIGKDEAVYLLIRSPQGAYTVREVTEYFTCGQQEPHIEVFQPNTDRLRDFEERAINSAVIHTLLKQRDEKVPEEEMRVKVYDIERQFNRAILDKDIKRRIRRRVVQPVRPPGQRRRVDEWDDDADEFELNPSYRFEDDLMIHRMCPVEEVCAYDSMRAAKAQLEAGRDRDGIARIRKLIGTSMTQMQNAFQSVMRGTTPAQRKGLLDLELLLQLQPWNQTVEFLAAVGGRAVLHLNPSRRLREKTGKFYHYVRRQPPKETVVDAQPKVKPGTVTGTDADLRKLTMPQSERILKGFGVPESTIKSLHRWKRIGLIRELSGAATQDKNAEHSGLSRFARSLRVGIQQQMKEQKDAANKIFKNMRKALSDKKGARRGFNAGSDSSDDGGDDDDDDESSEEESDSDDSLADELEQGMDKADDGPDPEDERRELEEMRRLMGGEGGAPGESRPVGSTQIPPGKKLVLKRIVTKTYPDGRVEKIEDDVSEAVGDAWMKSRKFKPDGEVDLEKSRESVMKILYPHGVDPPQFVSGDQAARGGGTGGGGGQAMIGATFTGPEARKAELIRQRKRKMEMLRRRKKRFAQLQAESGVSAQDLEKLKEKQEAEAAPKPGAGPLKLSFLARPPPKPPPKGKTKGRRGADEDDYTDYGGPRKTTTRFRGNRRDEILMEIVEEVMRNPAFVAFCSAVTKKMVPDYREFVDRPMDLSTIAKNLRRAGGYHTADAWMQDVRQILANAKLYHESEEEAMMRHPAIVPAAQQMVEEAEKAVERRAADLKLADQFFDAEKVLGRPLSAEAQEAVDNVGRMVFPGGVTASGAPVAPPPKEEPTSEIQPAAEPEGGFGANPELA